MKIHRPKSNEVEDVKVDKADDRQGAFSNDYGFTYMHSRVDPRDVEDVELPSIGCDETKCYVKVNVVTKNGKEKLTYYIKSGGVAGCLYNPWGTFSEGMENVESKVHGKKVWNFSKVTKSVFDLYVKFLKTRNNSWYVLADREFRNG